LRVIKKKKKRNNLKGFQELALENEKGRTRLWAWLCESVASRSTAVTGMSGGSLSLFITLKPRVE